MRVTPVEPIPSPRADAHVATWVAVGFTKLRLWQLPYRKLLYIDADCVAVANPDELFARSGFAAAPDIFPPGACAAHTHARC